VLAQTTSFAILGIDALRVRVEVDVVPGLPTFTVVGLPDNAVRESRNRVASALANVGFDFPLRRITVNLAPATVRKEGSAFDLPIALGILAATGQLPLASLRAWSSLGELSLTGELRPVRGVLCAAMAHRAEATGTLLVPAANLPETGLVPGVRFRVAASLSEAASLIRSGAPGRIAGRAAPENEREDIGPAHVSASASETMRQGLPALVLLADPPSLREGPDLSDVRGQGSAKRALEIAAAGGHNLLFVGPPGAGKSMLARRLPGILPPMSREEVLETTRIHSVAGLLDPARPVIAERPFRSPHHTVSHAGLVGGGSIPRPGEVSLAHNGVLFLDELPEFDRRALESLRQPLEDGRVTVSRARLALTYPARFTLLAAMNPCPCGDLTHPHRPCRCTEAEVRRYRGRISGPLLDRIDLHVDVPPVSVGDLAAGVGGGGGSARGPRGESAAARERVGRARERQLERYARVGIYCNAQLGRGTAPAAPRADPGALELLARAARAFHLSARAYHRTLRVARTIADMEATERIGAMHVSEALQYRPDPGTLACGFELRGSHALRDRRRVSG
jgi:magnesium chelatase family protein